MMTGRMGYGCGQCGVEEILCDNCHNCEKHCMCPIRQSGFDSDELGLDPESDNTPEDPSRYA